MSSRLARPYIPDDSDISSGQRDIVDGSHFNSYFTLPIKRRDKVELHDVEVEDTVQLMERVVHTYLEDTKEIAPLLRRETVSDTCAAIWNFLYHHIQYKMDLKGLEQLRRPSRSWADRTTGIDCDCFSIFVSSILVRLQIPHSFRITRYTAPHWQHVYVVVPKEGGKKGYYTIDPVLSKPLFEKSFTANFDYPMNLNGINVAVLDGIDDTPALPQVTNHDITMAHAIAGIDTELRDQLLDGLGSLNGKREATNWGTPATTPAPAPAPIQTAAPVQAIIPMVQQPVYQQPLQPIIRQVPVIRYRDRFLPAKKRAFTGSRTPQARRAENFLYETSATNRSAAIYNWLHAVFQAVNEDPHYLAMSTKNPKVFRANLHYLLTHWNHSSRNQALGAVVANEDTVNRRNGYDGDDGTINGIDDDMTLYGADDQLVDALYGLGSAHKPAKKKKKGGFFRSIGHGLKKVGKVAIKLNPLAIAARNGYLLAMKLNIGKMASHLKWGYATPQQAAVHHISAAQMQKYQAAVHKVENLFAGKLQGSKNALRKAILSGKKGNLNGLGYVNDGLGIVPVAAALAAAGPILAATVKILKDTGIMHQDEEVDVKGETADAVADNGSTDLYEDANGDGSNDLPSTDDLAPETKPTVTNSDDDSVDGLGIIPGVSFLKNNPALAAGAAIGVGYLAYKAFSGGTKGRSGSGSSAGLAGHGKGHKKTHHRKAGAKKHIVFK